MRPRSEWRWKASLAEKRRASAPAAAIVLVAGLAAGLAVGSTAFGVAVALAALVLGLGACTLVADAGPRPVVPAAVLLSVGLPGVAAGRPPAVGWAALPLVVALGVLAAFVLGIAFRRRGLVTVVGTTVLAGLLVGLGSSGLVLLRLAPEGVHWVVGAVVAVAAIEAARAVAPRLARVLVTRLAPPAWQVRLVRPAAAGAAAVLAAAGLASVLTPAAGVATAAVALGAVAAGSGLRRVLAGEPAPRPDAAGRDVAGVARWAVPLLLAAPPLALLAWFVPAVPRFPLFSLSMWL